jgi:hypothetical protein
MLRWAHRARQVRVVEATGLERAGRSALQRAGHSSELSSLAMAAAVRQQR